LLALAIFVNIQTSFWPSFIIYFIAIILIVGHFRTNAVNSNCHGRRRYGRSKKNS
jgi:hypothetical protein